MASSGDSFRLLESDGVGSDYEASAMLLEAIRRLHSAGANSPSEFVKAVEKLRWKASDTAVVAQRWIDAAGQDVILRWSLVYLFAAVRHEAYLNLLRGEAMRRPPERVRRQGKCEFSDSAELVIVMAIRGLEYLAQAGHERAVECLLEVLKRQERKWLREPAARAVVRVRPELRQRVEEMLPEHERYTLTLREATMRDFSVRLAKARTSASARRPSVAPPRLPSVLP